MTNYTDLNSLRKWNEDSFLCFVHRKALDNNDSCEAWLERARKLKHSISPRQLLAEIDIRALVINDESRQMEGQKSLAIISPMTPANTGVATCNLKSLLESSIEVDIYSVWNDLEEYIEFTSLLRTGLTAYPFSTLQSFARQNRYETIVASVGNSDHNVFIVIDATLFEYRKHVKNFVLHLHDGCVWNLVTKVLEYHNLDFVSTVLSSYAFRDIRDLQSIFKKSSERWMHIDALVNFGIFGLKILFELVKPTRIVVNSSYAAQMIELDFWPEICPIPVDIAFHPVFDSDARSSNYPVRCNSIDFRIGSFGIPSFGKCTDVIIEACKILQRQGNRVTLVLAGFGVNDFFADNPGLCEGVTLDVHSDISDDRLLELMDTVHIAVQLRKKNLGESSGVISTLIKKRVPLIASANGAFSGYKDCSLSVNDDISASELSSMILYAINDDDVCRTLVENQDIYVTEHSSKILCDRLFLLE